MSKGSESSHYDGKIAGLYDLGDTLGRGHFAVVKLAKHVFTGEQVAVKVIDKTKLDDVSRAHLFQEVRCMKLVQHPNVVRLYEVIDTQTKLYLILELGDGGDMYDYIMKHEKGVDEETVKKYFLQIVHAISYCHRLHVVHRDLKPENVVFFEKLGMVKLTDFGFSNKFCPGQKLETSCGSLAYSAPEILLGDSYDAPKVDVWSLGVILYMLACGHAPFQEANDSETLTMIMDCKYTIPSYVSPGCRRLIEHMLIRDPEKRASLEEIANDPWLNSGDTLQPSQYLPLVSREHLSEEDHAHIIQKMVNGNIAMKEEILEALDRNDYNHITATYFLLAERKLRAQRQERAQMMNSRMSRADLSPLAVTPGVSSASPSPAQEQPVPVDSFVSPCIPTRTLDNKQFGMHLTPPGAPTSAAAAAVAAASSLTTPRSTLPLGRKCSIVREEEDTSSNASGSSSPVKSPPKEESVQMQENREPEAKKTESLEASNIADPPKVSPMHRPVLSLPVQSSTTGLIPGRSPLSPLKQSPTSVLNSLKFKTMPSSSRRLHSVQSSPQLLLNEINEEGEAESEAGAHIARYTHLTKHCHQKLHLRGSLLSPSVLKVLGHRQRFAKNRTASCSSSDASDDDGENFKRKVDKLKKSSSSSRRDSHDDGGGDCGHSRGGGGAGGEGNGSDGGGNNGGGGNSGGNCGDSGQTPDDETTGGGRSGNGVSGRCGEDVDCGENRMQQDSEALVAKQHNHIKHVVFSTDSNDSLDLLSEPQPRLVNSISCGDLSTSMIHTSPDQKSDLIHSDSITLTELPQGSQSSPLSSSSSSRKKQRHLLRSGSSKSFGKISVSVSLNSGLSCLQQKAQNLRDSVHEQTVKNRNCKSSQGKGLAKFVHSSSRSTVKQLLDINQNGWRKSDGGRSSKKDASERGQRAVMEGKMASKCCTLC